MRVSGLQTSQAKEIAMLKNTLISTIRALVLAVAAVLATAATAPAGQGRVHELRLQMPEMPFNIKGPLLLPLCHLYYA